MTGSTPRAKPIFQGVTLPKKMNMKQSVESVFSQYATFNGRASRSEYWWFQLALYLVILLLIVVPIIHMIGVILAPIIFILAIVPCLAVGSRRLHDSNKSGWYQLIGLVPFIGSIALLVLFAWSSDKGENQYGSP